MLGPHCLVAIYISMIFNSSASTAPRVSAASTSYITTEDREMLPFFFFEMLGDIWSILGHFTDAFKLRTLANTSDSCPSSYRKTIIWALHFKIRQTRRLQGVFRDLTDYPCRPAIPLKDLVAVRLGR